MPPCELCDRGHQASCIVGTDEDLAYRDEDRWLRLLKKQVKYACAQCADVLVSEGDAREMPLESGEAHEIWYSNCVEITDGEVSIWSMEAPDMTKMT